ncbi:MAG: PAS domain-containing protein [Verrucomicrobiota bacterium]
MSEAFPSPPRPFQSPAPANESLDSSILRELMDTSVDRIYFKDLQSRFVRNNATHARSLGAASPEACIGKTDFDFFSREHAEHAFRDEQEIIRTGRPIISQLERLTMRDGRKGWASSTKMPWRDATGKIIGTFGVTRDVTAAQDAEEKLKEERNLLRTIIDNLPSRLYVKDTQSRYVLNNKAHIAMLGAESQEQALGRTTVDFFPGERGLQALADDRLVLDGASMVNQEKSDFGPDGDVLQPSEVLHNKPMATCTGRSSPRCRCTISIVSSSASSASATTSHGARRPSRKSSAAPPRWRAI